VPAANDCLKSWTACRLNVAPVGPEEHHSEVPQTAHGVHRLLLLLLLLLLLSPILMHLQLHSMANPAQPLWHLIMMSCMQFKEHVTPGNLHRRCQLLLLLPDDPSFPISIFLF
jgi:hypothetical protein